MKLDIQQKYLPLVLVTALAPEARVAHRIFSFTKIRAQKQYKLFTSSRENIYLLQAGIGSRWNQSLLTQWLSEIHPSLLINYGICGILDNNIPLHESFLITRVSSLSGATIDVSDRNPLPEKAHLPDFPRGALLTVHRPILDRQRREQLWRKTRLPLVDMEGLMVAQWARHLQIPLIVLKYTSDFADENAEKQVSQDISVWQKGLHSGLLKLLNELS